MHIENNCQAVIRSIYGTSLNHGIVTLDLAGNIKSWNVGAERMLGYSSEEIIGRHYGFLFVPEDVDRGEPELELQIAQAKGRAEDYRWHLRKDGSRFWTNGFTSLIHDGHDKHIGYLKMFQDITDIKQAEEDMHRIAYRDKLTELPNRHLLEIQAKEKIVNSLRSGQPMALHLIDLDGFKRVNDTLGHQAGDLLLQQCARRMRRVIRDNDFVARLGGDEFVVLQVNMHSIAASAELASKLIKTLSLPFDIGNMEVKISASVGLAICPNDASELDSLLKKADLALYLAKKEGKANYHYFTAQLDKIAHRKEQELGDLKHAIDRKEFGLVYQPIISLTTNEIAGIEVLLRCRHAGLRSIPMENVVDLAVENGLMKNLSYWVVQEACKQLKEWRDCGLNHMRLAINLCSQDLVTDETVRHIDKVISETGLRHEDLEIELTERQALEVEKHGISTLKTLRSRGIDIALDDFGTGYSALSYLRKLPVTAIKLDRSFLLDIPSNHQGSALIKSVAGLARALDLDVVAEGVENEEQVNFLRENECSEMQGYWISQPMSAVKITKWIRDYEGRAH